VETRFLIPQTTFPATWLGACQQYVQSMMQQFRLTIYSQQYKNIRHWEEKPDLKQNVDTELQRGHTEIELARDGLDGKVLGYHEVTSRDADLTAKNSTSLQRQFGDTKNFVRGKGNNFPFAPGGIENVLQDSVDAMADGMLKEKDILFDFTEDHLLSKPPGLERGLLLANETGKLF
jgi:antiviral helicase SKI2